LCLAIGLVLLVFGQNKYFQYQNGLKNQLFQKCVPNEDYMACYLCGGLQTCGTLADPHDAFFLGAQLARERAGLV
jgi:hypothetical protein